jgi:hypothetical protein
MGKRSFGCSSLVALITCAFVACGGKSEDDGDGDHTSAGSGGSDICSLPPDSGPCEAAIQRYAFDASTGLCLPFVYGGCEGNANNFESAEACYAACGGHGEIDPTACERPADCVLVPATCCGGCDFSTISNVVAIASGHESSVTVAMGCDLVDCVPCDPPPTNPWLFAGCFSGRCIAVDAQQTEITECTQASDCVLRGGLGCCEACNPATDEIVAVNASVDLEPWLCGAAPDECDACTPTPPRLVSASCEGMRCSVVLASPPPD